MRRFLVMAAHGVAFVLGSGFVSPSVAAAGTAHLVAKHGKHKHKGHGKHHHKTLSRHHQGR